ncbi:MAG TPA: hypothetical protein VHO24_12920, partial [Opitutaceae bacterium]|nr:hypothetical protein [Opitutaceae bacterium]
MTPHVTQLFTLLAGQGNFSRLAEAVARAEAKMTEAGERDLWLFWRAHSLLLLGQLNEARTYIDQIQNPERIEAIELMVKRVMADNGDRGPLIAALEERFAKTHDPLHLIELCNAYQSVQRWDDVAKHAAAIVDGVKTPAALALAVEAAQRTSNPTLCLELLDGRESLFPNNIFPVNFRRGRVQALAQIGSPERALDEAEAIARETDDSRDIMNLVALRLQCADSKGAVIAARKLLTREDVSAESHLRLANSLKVEDHAAAAAHLERALAKKNDSPQFVAGAMDLSFKLNREDKLAELQPAVVKAAASGGPIMMAGPEKMVEILRAQNERRVNAESLYISGRIPLHLALEFFGGTLAGVYHSRFRPFESGTWPPAAPIYVLHGGRAAAPAPPTMNRLHVDTTSLLLASELGILDLVERAFAPLYLPHSIVAVLYRQLEEASPHQPSKLIEARIISGLLGTSAISVTAPLSEKDAPASINRPSADWLTLADIARKSGGVIVDYLPVTIGFPPRVAELIEDEPQLVVGIASVLRTLEEAAVLTAEASAGASQRLHSFADGEARTIPKGTTLLVRGNIVEVLAGAGLLEVAAKYFRVSIDADEEQ